MSLKGKIDKNGVLYIERERLDIPAMIIACCMQDLEK